jgi:hypothetical protein
MIAVNAGPARRARLVLAPGRTVLDAVTQALDGLGWRSATLQLLGGPLARAVFTCSVLTPSGPRWIDYGPRRDAGACWLVLGSATFGAALEGGAALHCHAMLADARCGAQGGHIVPDETVIGLDGLVAHAVSGAEAGFRITGDATGFSLLSPTAWA